MTDALHWKPAASPKAEPIDGRFIRLEKLDPVRHGDDLWAALQGRAPTRYCGTTCPTARLPNALPSTAGCKVTPPATTRCISP